jgi:acyl-CoA synthetase (AMP-forming)/AMP-acid ligase II
MDWDSHRYLECFFAVPMMGAVLHTINVRISPEQILYTINHAQDDVILVNAEFLPILEAIHDKIRPGVQARADQRPAGGAALELAFATTTRRCCRDADPSYRVPRSSEDTRATTFYTTGTTGSRRASITATASSSCTRWALRRRSATRRMRRSRRATCTCRSRRCSTCTHGAFRISRRCSA